MTAGHELGRLAYLRSTRLGCGCDQMEHIEFGHGLGSHRPLWCDRTGTGPIQIDGQVVQADALRSLDRQLAL